MKCHKFQDGGLPFPVYSLEISEIGALINVNLPSENSVILLAADFTNCHTDEISEVAMQLISKGLKYILCWGEGCEVAHYAFDLGNVLWEENENKENHVMSTWHDDESFEDALWFCLYNASPDDQFWDSTSIIVVSVEQAVTKAQLAYLDDIQALNEAVGV